MSCLGHGTASTSGSSETAGRKRTREPDRSPIQAANNVTTSAHSEASESSVGRPPDVPGIALPQEYISAGPTYPLPGVDFAPTTVPEALASDQWNWAYPTVPAPVNPVDLAYDFEPFDNGAALAALFGYSSSADELPTVAEPPIDPWAFALGSAGLSFQSSSGDAQADITDLFGSSSQDTPRSE